MGTSRLRSQFEYERLCPGLRAGWYLRGQVEEWFEARPCGARRGVLRWLVGNVCRGCVREAYRRGFRINYDEVP